MFNIMILIALIFTAMGFLITLLYSLESVDWLVVDFIIIAIVYLLYKGKDYFDDEDSEEDNII